MPKTILLPIPKDQDVSDGHSGGRVTGRQGPPPTDWMTWPSQGVLLQHWSDSQGAQVLTLHQKPADRGGGGSVLQPLLRGGCWAFSEKVWPSWPRCPQLRAPCFPGSGWHSIFEARPSGQSLWAKLMVKFLRIFNYKDLSNIYLAILFVSIYVSLITFKMKIIYILNMFE